MRSAFHPACERPLQFVAMNYMPGAAAAGTLAAHFAPDFVPFTNHRHGMARILLVEDDANVLMLLEHVLCGDGYDVDTASTVEQARSHLAQRPGYDLVVADGRLPDGTGMAGSRRSGPDGGPARGLRDEGPGPGAGFLRSPAALAGPMIPASFTGSPWPVHQSVPKRERISRA